MNWVGTAGWTIPARYKDQFPGKGSHLERYATRLNGVEINSSFYRPHRRVTYQRWAASVPKDFRFSVKVPRAITQNHHLTGYGDLLDRYLEQVSGLEEKLGVLLVQLPPSLGYDRKVARAFFHRLAVAETKIACEPRHSSWFTVEADEILDELQVSRVAADPPRAPTDGIAGGNTHMAYFRLHGSPKVYYSDYAEGELIALAPKLRGGDWCIFDNTAAFHALGNALMLNSLLSK